MSKPIEYWNTGCSVLNLICSGSVTGGFRLGRVVRLVGDKSSGKSFIALTALATACSLPAFNKHIKYYDDAEAGDSFDKEKLFGIHAKEIIPLMIDDGEPCACETIEEFYYGQYDLLEKEIPYLYVEDSMDALSSEQEGKKFQEQKKAHEAGKEEPGSHTDGKAKKNSQHLRKIVGKIRKTNSGLVLISQTRQAMGTTFKTKVTAGGDALEFYSSLSLWFAPVRKITKTFKGIPREIGVQSRCRVKKNKITGKYMDIDIPIYYNYGIDNLECSINYLLTEKHWEGKAWDKIKKVKVPEWEVELTIPALIEYIEENDLEDDLNGIVQGVWDEVEEALCPKRKDKFKKEK